MERGPAAEAGDSAVASSKVTKGLAPLTAAVVAAYVQHNPLSSSRPARFATRGIHGAYPAFAPASPESSDKLDPAVPISHSVTRDYIICLEDGKRFKSMKRHLRGLGMTPVEYRNKVGLIRGLSDGRAELLIDKVSARERYRSWGTGKEQPPKLGIGHRE